MSEANYSAPVKDLGDKIVALSLLQAKELSDYLKNVYGLEAAAAAAVTVSAAVF
jgi:large subunit ribosomal protein L7/L12